MKPPPSSIPIPTKTLLRAIYWTVLAAIVVAFTAWWLAIHHTQGRSFQKADGKRSVEPAESKSWRVEVASGLSSAASDHQLSHDDKD